MKSVTLAELPKEDASRKLTETLAPFETGMLADSTFFQ